MPAGRPTDYSEELASEICARIAEGRSLRSICSDDDMPCTRTFFRWIAKYPEFSQQYDKAIIERAEMLVEDMLHIADTSEAGDAAKTRIQVDVRKWHASKMKPKKYGDSSEPEKKIVPFIVNTFNESDTTSE